jgi:uncharacterized protein
MRLPILALALVAVPAAMPAAAQTAPSIGSGIGPGIAPMVPATGTVLDVVAEGRTTRVPDLATIRAGVVTQAPTAAAALSDNSARTARVLARLRRAGIAERDIATASVQLSPQYRYAESQPPAITGYQATNTVSIRFRDVAKSGGVLDALVAEGANQIDGPALSLSDPDAALDEARADAVKRARAKAEQYARAAGMRVERIVSIAEAGQDAGGPDRPPVVFARAAMAEAKTEVAPGEKDVTVTLNVRFVLG